MLFYSFLQMSNQLSKSCWPTVDRRRGANDTIEMRFGCIHMIFGLSRPHIHQSSFFHSPLSIGSDSKPDDSIRCEKEKWTKWRESPRDIRYLRNDRKFLSLLLTRFFIFVISSFRTHALPSSISNSTDLPRSSTNRPNECCPSSLCMANANNK